MTLNKLIEKGLASFVMEGQRKHYQAADPKHIVEFINEKKKDSSRYSLNYFSSSSSQKKGQRRRYSAE